jgi:hypothetical protein
LVWNTLRDLLRSQRNSNDFWSKDCEDAIRGDAPPQLAIIWPLDLLKGDRSAAGGERCAGALHRVKPTEVGGESIQGLVCQPPNLPERMGGWDSIFCGDVREQGPGSFLQAAHPFSTVIAFSRKRLAFSAAF